MRINFELTFTTTSYEILAEIGYEEEKKEYIVYLQAIDEAQGNAVDYLHDKLLSKFPVSTAKNIILEFQSLLLIDQNQILTDLGREALESRTIFEPLKGVYNIEIVKHSPLKSPILNLLPEKVKGKDAQIDPVIQAELNKSITLLDNQTIRILSVEKQGRRSNTSNKLILQFVYENNTWSVYTKRGRNQQKLELSQEFLNLHLEDTILEELDPVPGRPDTIYVALSGLSDKEISSFGGNRTLKDFRISQYNTMTMVNIAGLNFLPKDTEASDWATRLFLLKYLTDYQTPSEVQATWNYMINEIKQFAHYTIIMPSINQLLKITTNRQTWYLQAPLDFELEGIL